VRKLGSLGVWVFECLEECLLSFRDALLMLLLRLGLPVFDIISN
jgi:hypothetical protein